MPMGQWTQMRAITPQWPWWIARQLLLPVARVPLTITTRTGARYELGSDPVDDAILRSVGSSDRDLYFPPSMEPGKDIEGVILDVGAHHGLYAVEALRRYPRCRLIAVEPDRAACERLRANVALNGLEARVRVVNAGVGGARKSGRLVRDPAGSWATIVEPSQEGDAQLLTLEEILEGERPVIVKTNSEGAEFALVPQMIALGLRPSCFVLMAHPRWGSADALTRLLASAGYEVRDADAPSRGQRFHCRAGSLRSTRREPSASGGDS